MFGVWVQNNSVIVLDDWKTHNIIIIIIIYNDMLTFDNPEAIPQLY